MGKGELNGDGINFYYKGKTLHKETTAKASYCQ